ncbi:DUF397 domain-containing protein [Micromonospora sp. NPDC020750]|uniref:DUF397 domain-containing protein n=1 Tax=unclassified Micromonospora TaxID=2617518 RepID=UPI003798108F
MTATAERPACPGHIPQSRHRAKVATLLPGVVLVRDTKNRHGGTLTFASDAWRGFVALA